MKSTVGVEKVRPPLEAAIAQLRRDPSSAERIGAAREQIGGYLPYLNHARTHASSAAGTPLDGRQMPVTTTRSPRPELPERPLPASTEAWLDETARWLREATAGMRERAFREDTQERKAMSDTAAEEEAMDRGLEIQSERREATIGAVKDAQDRHRVGEEETSGSCRSRIEHEHADGRADDDPSSDYGYGPRR